MSDEEGIALRAFRDDDALVLAAIYVAAVRTLGPASYTPAQVDAWAAIDEAEFCACLARGVTLVAEQRDTPVAFGQLTPLDHVHLLYTAPSHGRRGIATLVLTALEAHALALGARSLTTYASHLSRPLFARRGFSVIATERSVHRGVAFMRFRMAKRLTAGTGGQRRPRA